MTIFSHCSILPGEEETIRPLDLVGTLEMEFSLGGDTYFLQLKFISSL